MLERAWAAQQRLHRRFHRMAGRGKPRQKIVVACARELAGFVWAIATDQPLRKGALEFPRFRGHLTTGANRCRERSRSATNPSRIPAAVPA